MPAGMAAFRFANGGKLKQVADMCSAHPHPCCAQVVFNNYKEGDVVWVQDYHLMLLPALLKQRFPRMKVG